MYATLVCDFLTGGDVFRWENVHDGKLGVRYHFTTLLCEIQHGLVGIGKGRSCDLFVFCRIGCIQADGDAVHHLSQFRYDIAFMIQVSKSVGIHADGETCFFLDIAGAGNEIVQCTGGLSVATENKFFIACKIKGIDGCLNLV